MFLFTKDELNALKSRGKEVILSWKIFGKPQSDFCTKPQLCGFGQKVKVDSVFLAYPEILARLPSDEGDLTLRHEIFCVVITGSCDYRALL